jgi:hypothetical protein
MRLPVVTMFMILTCAGFVFAQGPPAHSPQMQAPPPMKFISRDERAQLDGAGDPKSRIRLAIDLADSHLNSAEQDTTRKQFDAAAEELGRYVGLVEDALSFLSKLNSDKGKIRDLYRHLDINLRQQIPRLAVMRRDTPAEYAVNIKAAEDYVREARSNALESFYGHTVVSEELERKLEKPNNKPSTPESKHP